MLDKCKKLYKKYEEIIAYVFFGGLTTLVNIVVFLSSMMFYMSIILQQMQRHGWPRYSLLM